MSGTLETISHLVASDAYRVSNHAGRQSGPSVLVLCSGPDLPPTHALWGLHRLNPAIAVLITAYIPDVNVWSSDLMTRKGK